MDHRQEYFQMILHNKVQATQECSVHTVSYYQWQLVVMKKLDQLITHTCTIAEQQQHSC